MKALLIRIFVVMFLLYLIAFHGKDVGLFIGQLLSGFMDTADGVQKGVK